MKKEKGKRNYLGISRIERVRFPNICIHASKEIKTVKIFRPTEHEESTGMMVEIEALTKMKRCLEVFCMLVSDCKRVHKNREQKYHH